jgi:hypothetical protein
MICFRGKVHEKLIEALGSELQDISAKANKKAPRKSRGFEKIRRRPTLPRSPPRSTIGAEELNFRVRDGNGCDLFAIATETKKSKIQGTPSKAS